MTQKVILEKVAKHMHMSPVEIIQKGTEAMLREKKKSYLNERLEILIRYNVSSKKELEDKIRLSKIPEHPAWEDLIELENIESELKQIDEDFRNLQKS